VHSNSGCRGLKKKKSTKKINLLAAKVVPELQNIFFETIDGSCVLGFRKRYAITTYHGNRALALGTRLTIYHVNSRTPREVDVVFIEQRCDFLILRAAAGHLDLISINCDIAEGIVGEDCYQIGFSVLRGRSAFEKFYVDKGVIGSMLLDLNGHVLASPGANPGDSGGGCFRSALPIQILGMIVGNQHPVELTSRNILSDLFYAPRTLLVPASVIGTALSMIEADTRNAQLSLDSSSL
jgi:hypothetical protein